MNKLIYGSQAMKYFFNDFNRDINDIDYIVDNQKYISLLSKGKENKMSCSIKEWDLIQEYYYLPEFSYIFDNNEDNKYVDPNFLYTIKISHLSYDNRNWTKHMKDAIFLKSKWCEIDKTLYKELMKWWERVLWKKHVKMNVRNEEFFKENIERRYNHEYLHEMFAFYDRPLNEKIRKDLWSPLCSKELWNKLSYKEQLECALEELYVLTAERCIFIDNSRYNWRESFIQISKIKILKQMIVSTTTWWFNLFLKENFQELLDSKPGHIIQKIKRLY